MSVQVSVGDDTYVDLSNGGWSNFVDALHTAMRIEGVSAEMPLFDRNVYCDIPAAQCDAIADAIVACHGRIVAEHPHMASIADDVAQAFRLGANGEGVCIS